MRCHLSVPLTSIQPRSLVDSRPSVLHFAASNDIICAGVSCHDAVHFLPPFVEFYVLSNIQFLPEMLSP